MCHVGATITWHNVGTTFLFFNFYVSWNYAIAHAYDEFVAIWKKGILGEGKWGVLECFPFKVAHEHNVEKKNWTVFGEWQPTPYERHWGHNTRLSKHSIYQSQSHYKTLICKNNESWIIVVTTLVGSLLWLNIDFFFNRNGVFVSFWVMACLQFCLHFFYMGTCFCERRLHSNFCGPTQVLIMEATLSQSPNHVWSYVQN